MIFNNKAVVATMIMLAAATSVDKVAVPGATDQGCGKSGKNRRQLLLLPPGLKNSLKKNPKKNLPVDPPTEFPTEKPITDAPTKEPSN